MSTICEKHHPGKPVPGTRCPECAAEALASYRRAVPAPVQSEHRPFMEDWEILPPGESDICANKHKGNPESAEAFAANAANWSAERERIYDWFVRRGPQGATREECLIDLGIADPDGKARHGGYPRCAELAKAKRLVPKIDKKTGKRMRGKTVGGDSAAILVADIHRAEY
jgi:hypothetical protein